MKSAEAWDLELEFVVDGLSAATIAAIQADATADLQSQVEQLRGDVEVQIDAKLRAWKLNEDLRTALENCVVELEKARKYVRVRQGLDDALATAKPLLNKP